MARTAARKCRGDTLFLLDPPSKPNPASAFACPTLCPVRPSSIHLSAPSPPSAPLAAQTRLVPRCSPQERACRGPNLPRNRRTHNCEQWRRSISSSCSSVRAAARMPGDGPEPCSTSDARLPSPAPHPVRGLPPSASAPLLPLAGQPGVGKTCLVYRYLYNTFGETISVRARSGGPTRLPPAHSPAASTAPPQLHPAGAAVVCRPSVRRSR